MEEKLQAVDDEKARNRCTPIVIGICITVLSLFIAITIAGFTSVDAKRPQHSIKLPNGELERTERIEYDKGGYLMYRYGRHGAFQFDDFGQGIQLVRSSEYGICYVMLVGTDSNAAATIRRPKHARYAKHRIHARHVQELYVDGTEEKDETKIYDGKLMDSSFLPQKVQDECASGYQWMDISDRH